MPYPHAIHATFKEGIKGLTSLQDTLSWAKKKARYHLEHDIRRSADDHGLFGEQVDKLLSAHNDSYYHVDRAASFLLLIDATIFTCAQFEVITQFHILTMDVLVSACYSGNMHIIQWVLRTNPEFVHERDRYDETVLSSAVCVGNLSLVKWLVNEAKADVMLTNASGQTVLMQQVDLNIAQWLVENSSIELSYADNIGRIALSYAARYTQYDLVLYYLTYARQHVSNTLWADVQLFSGDFLYFDGVRKTRPSSLLCNMLMSDHPVPETVTTNQYHPRCLVRFCAKATMLKTILPTWITRKFQVLSAVLFAARIPLYVIQMVAVYSAPSDEEVWLCVSRRNPLRASRKRRMMEDPA